MAQTLYTIFQYNLDQSFSTHDLCRTVSFLMTIYFDMMSTFIIIFMSYNIPKITRFSICMHVKKKEFRRATINFQIFSNLCIDVLFGFLFQKIFDISVFALITHHPHPSNPIFDTYNCRLVVVYSVGRHKCEDLHSDTAMIHFNTTFDKFS